jgi:hypothetical protein
VGQRGGRGENGTDSIGEMRRVGAKYGWIRRKVGQDKR